MRQKKYDYSVSEETIKEKNRLMDIETKLYNDYKSVIDSQPSVFTNAKDSSTLASPERTRKDRG